MSKHFRKADRDRVTFWLDALSQTQDPYSASVAWNGIVEISSGAIIPDQGAQGRYRIETNTDAGLRAFLAREVRSTDAQSESGYGLGRKRRSASYSWESPRSKTMVFLLGCGQPTSEQQHPSPESADEPEPPDPEALLQALAADRTTHEDVRKSVFEAEALSFSSDQIKRLQPLLRRYIERYRDSDDPADIIAVASAIRRYVAFLNRDELSTLDFLLDAGHKAAVPVQIELELAKMVTRKLSANLPRTADALPELGNQLMDLARTYLNPRLLPRQHHAAIALNSIMALVLLRSAHLEELYGILKHLRVSWFKQLVARRAQSIGQDLTSRLPENEWRAHRESLEALVRVLEEEAL